MKKVSKNEGRVWYALPIVLVAVFLVCALLGGLGYFEVSPPEKTCISCHEIRASHAMWTNSVHRGVSCKACHGGSADSWHALRENAKRVYYHISEKRHDDMRLSEEQSVRMVYSCRKCHEREFAYWSQGGHGVNYSAIFLDEKHNRTEQMAEQCLLCHGMFYEGRISELVTPLNIQGPWSFKNPVMAERSAVPCLACHQMHAPGKPFRHEDVEKLRAVSVTNALPFRRDTLAFYVRQEKRHIAIDDLMVPYIVDNGRPVKVATDPRQRLCTQCHAPDAFGNAGSSDDRTPVGVHEGISCVACHAPHSNDARRSCVLCHPAQSNCGIDVRTMDTTYLKKSSKHNIHSVKCIDCHPAGVPKKKEKAPKSVSLDAS